MSKTVDCFIDRDNSGHWYLVEEEHISRSGERCAKLASTVC